MTAGWLSRRDLDGAPANPRAARCAVGVRPMWLGLLVAICLLGACAGAAEEVARLPELLRGSGNIVSESRAVQGFHRVSLTAGGRILLTQAEDESLIVEADDNLMRYIQTDVRSGTLTLGLTPEAQGRQVRPSETIRFLLAVRDLDSLSISGAGDLFAKRLDTARIKVTVTGMGDVRIDDLQAESLLLHIQGGGEFDLAGEVGHEEIRITGMGHVRAGDLCARSAAIAIPGSGNATVWVTDRLDVQISGLGQVEYYGHPQVKQAAGGVGALIHRERK